MLTRTLDAAGKELRYFYDAKNRVTKTGAGSTADIMPTYNYYNDTTGMMTKVRYTDAASNTADVQYFFNKARQMTKLTDWTGDLEYRYSDIGQLTKLIDYDDAELTYAYDAVGRVTSMTDYHGATTVYEYDDGGRLTLLTAPGSKVWEFVYNDLGQPIEPYNPYGSAAKSRFFQCNLGDLKGLTRTTTRLRRRYVWLLRMNSMRAGPCPAWLYRSVRSRDLNRSVQPRRLWWVSRVRGLWVDR